MGSYLAESKMGAVPILSSSTLFYCQGKVNLLYKQYLCAQARLKKTRFSHCPIDVDHGKIPPIPTNTRN